VQRGETTIFKIGTVQLFITVASSFFTGILPDPLSLMPYFTFGNFKNE
jgi:hypothetical protein